MTRKEIAIDTVNKRTKKVFEAKNIVYLTQATSESHLLRSVPANEQLSAMDILSMASHEMRQFFQVIHVLNGAMNKMIEDKETKKIVLKQEKAIRNMAGLLDAMITLGEYERHALKPVVSRFSIATVFEQMKEEFSEIIDHGNIRFIVEPCKMDVSSNAYLLTDIIRNLLSNAIKYTAEGEITLGCRKRKHGLLIVVRDTGRGIPKEDEENIFSMFYRSGNAKNECGNGLGLAIVRRLADTLGHRVKVRSMYHKGTEFTVEVPYASDSSHNRVCGGQGMQ